MVDGPHDHENIWDLIVIWIGALLGHITLSQAVLWSTLLYTLMKLFVLIRNEFFRK